jgi:hypothetical protein
MSAAPASARLPTVGYSAYLPALVKVRWQFFGHLTFKYESEPEARRLARFTAVLRAVIRRRRTYFPDLLWCLRQEYGDLGGRVHFHFLLAGLPHREISAVACRQFETKWKRKGGGTAKMEVFDPALGGVAYALKISAQDARSREGRESAKFGPGDCELMLSDGLRRLLGIRR